jgi:branched-chain amino acid transport system ATP-binding protein
VAASATPTTGEPTDRRTDPRWTTDPDLLLVDEPFADLSDGEVENVSGLLTELREEDLTLVVIDHNMRGLLSLIDRAIVIQFGSKIAEGTPEEVKANEKVQQAYLGGDV